MIKSEYEKMNHGLCCTICNRPIDGTVINNFSLLYREYCSTCRSSVDTKSETEEYMMNLSHLSYWYDYEFKKMKESLDIERSKKEETIYRIFREKIHKKLSEKIGR